MYGDTGGRRGTRRCIEARSTKSHLLPKVEIEVVVGDDVLEEVIEAVVKAARTGEIGDGRVFVLPVEQAYNIRTGERNVI